MTATGPSLPAGEPPLESLPDEDLAVRVQQGCSASFCVLVDRHGARLLRFLCRKTGNLQDGEDLVQETFVRAYRYIYLYRPAWGFSGWLFTIAARLASTHRRRMLRACASPDAEGPVDPSPLDQVSQREDRAGLWNLARTLSPNQYDVLWLRYAEGLSIQEIARAIRKSQVHVRVLLYRARANMAKRLQVPAEGDCLDRSGNGRRGSLVETGGV